MVAQPAGVDRLRDEVVAQGVHLDQRGQLRGVAEVVGVDAAGQRRRGLGLDRDHPCWLAAHLLAEEREHQPREVRAAAGAPDEHVRLLAGHLHLEDRLLADHRLVEQDVVEDRPEGVLGVVAGRGVLHRLADREAEGAGVVGCLGQDARPDAVVAEGRRHLAPKVSISIRRYGFWS